MLPSTSVTGRSAGAPAARLESIQMMRGVAAMLVVYNHAAFFLARDPDLDLGGSVLAPSDRLAALGAIGVDLFFIISGFLMAYTARDLFGVRDSTVFMARRWIRIAPLFYLVSVVIGLVLWVGQTPVSLTSVLNSLTFIPLLDGEDYSWPVHYLGWTLAFEFTFYVIVALAVASGIGASPALLIAVTLLLPVAGWWLAVEQAALKILFSPMMWEFSMGVAAYALWRSGWLGRVAPYTAIVALLLGAVLMLLVMRPVGSTTVAIGLADNALEGTRLAAARALNWGLPMLLLFLVALGSPLADARRWDGRAMLVLGDASYSIYLTHLGVVRIAEEIVERQPVPADVAVAGVVLASAAVGIACFRWIERPMLAAGRALLQRGDRRRSGVTDAELPSRRPT